MKIGVRPHDLEFENTQELIDLCTIKGIDGLQLVCLRTYSEIMDKPELIDNEIQKILNSNVEIFLLGSYFNMIHPEQSKLESGYKIFKTNSEIAKRNKISYIGSETGSVNGDSWTYHPDNHTPSSFTKLRTSIEIITNYLEDTNQLYLLEPVYDHVSHNLEVTKSMMFNDKVALTLDLVNLLNIENYQDYLQIFEDFIRVCGSKIKVFHFKNFNIVDDKKVLCQLNLGVIDYSKIVELVNKYQLDAVPIIVEEIQGDALFNSIDYLRKLEEL